MVDCRSHSRVEPLVLRLLAVLAFAASFLGPVSRGPAQNLSEAEWKQLDTFESFSLAKADQLFQQKQYRAAEPAYAAFAQEFPRSKALPYALLRRGRCLQLDNKRYEAIAVYNEVLDYFPNVVNQAAAALYFIGESCWQSGDAEKAMKAWLEMATDADYRRHDLAAGALASLGDNLAKLEKPLEAVEYYKQAAIDFRQRNPDVARAASEKAQRIYVCTAPNEARLREFYEQVGTFDWNPGKPSEADYWTRVRARVRQWGEFPPDRKDERAAHYRYWANVMEGKFPDNDEFQFDWAAFRLAEEGDVKKWIARLDAQYARGAREGDYGRVVRFIAAFGPQKEKVAEYYARLNFAKMNNADIVALVRALFESARQPDMARNAFDRIRADEMSEAEKLAFERFLWNWDGQLVERMCALFADKDAGRMDLLRYHHWRRDAGKGVPVADEMARVPAYARDAYWMKAELLQWSAKYPEARAAYQSADNPPQNVFRIAECYFAEGKLDQAVATYREIENFFPDQAPEAALRIACLFRDTKQRDRAVAEFRNVLKKYPKSGQSTAAHMELEALGIKIGGGVDAE